MNNLNILSNTIYAIKHRRCLIIVVNRKTEPDVAQTPGYPSDHRGSTKPKLISNSHLTAVKPKLTPL